MPYIAPWNATLNTFRAPVVLGLLPQEDAPELIQPLSLGSGFTGKNSGLYAIRVSYSRPVTGGESLTSPTSNSLSVANSSLIFKFPTSTTPVYTDNSPLAWDTEDFWTVYATPVNYGNTTVFQYLKEVRERRVASENYTTWTATTGGGSTTITLTAEQLSYLYTYTKIQDWLIGKTVTAGVQTGVITAVNSLTSFVVDATWGTLSGATITIKSLVSGFTDERITENEWTENDLDSTVPPTNFYPPYTSDQFFSGSSFTNIAKFIVPLNNVMLLIGTDSGTGIAVSVPNFIEAFPPDYRLNLPESPIGVSYRAEDGYCYVFCKNSIHEIRWTGAVYGAPVVLRTITTSLGVANQKAVFVHNGIIYLFSSNNRIVRVAPDGSTDYIFSQPVTPYVNGWNYDAVVAGYDEKRNCILFFHRREFIAYHLDLKTWSSPINLSDFTPGSNIPDGEVSSVVSYRGICHIWDNTKKIVSGTIVDTHNFSTTIPQFISADIGKTVVATYADTSTQTGTVTAVPSTRQITVSFTINTGAHPIGQAVSIAITEGSTSTYTLDRSLLGVSASNAATACLQFQWNMFSNEHFGKTIKQAEIMGQNLPVSGVTLKMYADLLTSQLGTTRTFNVPSGKFVSDILDCNEGIGRMLSLRLDFTSSTRLVFWNLRVEYVTTRIRSNY